MKNIAVLGSTGSIGVQTLDIIRRRPDLFKALTLAAGRDLDTLESQIREFNPSLVSCADSQLARELEDRIGQYRAETKIVYGNEGLLAATVERGVEMVVVGLPGSAGLKPSFAAVEAGKDVALATKETLVMAGSLFMDLVARTGIRLLPVDSEQSAIFQCLEGNRDRDVKRILLTASGGPFRDLPKEEMENARKERALDHPRWKMGPKVTVDSGTLMNKGLEVIEARWLFDTTADRIEVVIHPQSIIHSMVEFQDGSIIAQLSDTDMRAAIGFALSHPKRIDCGVAGLNFPDIGALTFESPDLDRFPLLKAAYDSLQSDETVAPILLNAADEVAVEFFLRGDIPFGKIAPTVLEAMDDAPSMEITSLEDVIALHEDTCARVRRMLSEGV